ncbi:glycerate kinase [Paenibacillus sp. DXFW5]|uniref:Glycerate kinase n=1 Tax=Paenibacillus rhizolycopersici TaxID=2780073 RepID=A0ABS2H812_9BACL|nr:glycerate kinase [Paenibacillus rhizolycopersici]MBM6996134.1 glycerate kinase [Paenibacillus rhizolycopersici]
MARQPTFVLAPDSFKESMTAKEVCLAMEEGLRKAFPDARYVHVPMADGGEGTVQALVDATGGRLFSLEVVGPLGEPVTAQYGLLGDGETAAIELASASGLQQVPPDRRDPLHTTTYGTGELIRACLDQGVRRIIVGLGGSATNDGGAGMAEALGARFLDTSGRSLPRGGGRLGELARIDVSALDPRLQQTRLIVACDVDNPLCGERGASRVFGPQKGATASMAEQLDAALAHYAETARTRCTPKGSTRSSASPPGRPPCRWVRPGQPRCARFAAQKGEMLYFLQHFSLFSCPCGANVAKAATFKPAPGRTADKCCTLCNISLPRPAKQPEMLHFMQHFRLRALPPAGAPGRRKLLPPHHALLCLGPGRPPRTSPRI